MKASHCSPLFQPICVGNVKIKNRLVVPPMVTDYCDHDGMATERFVSYHEAKAKGGWGLIIGEDYAVDPLGRGFWTAGLWKDEQIASHAKLTDRVHDAGAKIVAQIYHAGRQTTPAVIGEQPVSCSPLACPLLGVIPRELSIAEIERTVCDFGDAALRAKKAGFDGVEVHGAHGYLIAQFMSNYSNKRCDQYGGPLENRLRFPLAIIADIREKCGPDFLIDFRISADEKVSGGRTIEETKAIAIRLAQQGIDMLHVSAGTYESTWAVIPPMNIEPGWIVDDAAEVKKVVDVPVIAVGRVNDPYLAEAILLAGKADLVAMGRASLADPELPNKFAEGRYDDIRQCIACQQGCLDILFGNEPIRCLVNPTLGYEYLHEFRKTDQPKKITVVGGGPAGMEAARTAASAGHEVTLYEQTAHMGGQFATAAVAPNKGDITAYISWLCRQVEKLGVDVKMNTKYSASICEKEKPDVVIVATGATPCKPSIPGINGKNVVTAEDILLGKTSAKQEVVVAGGGMVGCEAATYLASLGKQVTIVEMLPDIASDEEFTRRVLMLKDIERLHIQVIGDAKITQIKADCLCIEKEGKSLDVAADTVVLALGTTSNNALVQELQGLVQTKVIGDASEPRNALEATREAFLACANL